MDALPQLAPNFHKTIWGCCLERVRGMQRAGTANRTADFDAVERLVDDLANGSCATAALGAAAKAAINVARRTPRRGAGRASDLMITQYVAGTDNHRTPCPAIR